MRWYTKRSGRKFAFLPKKLDDGRWFWLERYTERITVIRSNEYYQLQLIQREVIPYGLDLYEQGEFTRHVF